RFGSPIERIDAQATRTVQLNAKARHDQCCAGIRQDKTSFVIEHHEPNRTRLWSMPVRRVRLFISRVAEGKKRLASHIRDLHAVDEFLWFPGIRGYLGLVRTFSASVEVHSVSLCSGSCARSSEIPKLCKSSEIRSKSASKSTAIPACV